MQETPTAGSVPDPGRDAGPFAWAGVRVGVLCNGVAGQGSDAAERAARVVDALRAHDAECDDLGTLPDSIPAQMERLGETKPQVVVAVGGDGTVNAGARVAIGVGASLLVVPTGTMNLIAKDLGVPLAIDRQLMDLTRVRPLRVDFGEVNGEVFLHSAALGFVPEMTRLREALRASEGPVDWTRNAARFARGLGAVSSRRVRMATERGEAERRTRSLLVTCNPLAAAGIVSHNRATLAAGTLGVYASAHEGAFASLRLCFSLALGGLSRDAGTDWGTCESLSVETGRSMCEVSCDGEIAELRTPLEFQCHQRGLSALVCPDWDRAGDGPGVGAGVGPG